jgi:hypothetical protein
MHHASRGLTIMQQLRFFTINSPEICCKHIPVHDDSELVPVEQQTHKVDVVDLVDEVDGVKPSRNQRTKNQQNTLAALP